MSGKRDTLDKQALKTALLTALIGFFLLLALLFAGSSLEKKYINPNFDFNSREKIAAVLLSGLLAYTMGHYAYRNLRE